MLLELDDGLDLHFVDERASVSGQVLEQPAPGCKVKPARVEIEASAGMPCKLVNLALSTPHLFL
jgi:hypothetical protein